MPSASNHLVIVAAISTMLLLKYRNDPKFSDRHVWADRHEEPSDQGLHVYLLDALLYGKIMLFKF